MRKYLAIILFLLPLISFAQWDYLKRKDTLAPINSAVPTIIATHYWADSRYMRFFYVQYECDHVLSSGIRYQADTVYIDTCYGVIGGGDTCLWKINEDTIINKNNHIVKVDTGFYIPHPVFEPRVGWLLAWEESTGNVHPITVNMAGDSIPGYWYLVSPDTLKTIFNVGIDSNFQVNYGNRYIGTLTPKGTNWLPENKFVSSGIYDNDSMFSYSANFFKATNGTYLSTLYSYYDSTMAQVEVSTGDGTSVSMSTTDYITSSELLLDPSHIRLNANDYEFVDLDSASTDYTVYYDTATHKIYYASAGVLAIPASVLEWSDTTAIGGVGIATYGDIQEFIDTEEDPIWTSDSTDYALKSYVNEATTQYFFDPDLSILTRGTAGLGTVDSLDDHDGNVYQINEVSGAIGINITIQFDSVNKEANKVVIHGNYAGSSTHDVAVQVWNFDDNAWESYYTMGNRLGMEWIEFTLPDPDEHRQNDSIYIRFYHAQNGTSSHRLYLDYLSVVKSGFGSSSYNEIDPYYANDSAALLKWSDTTASGGVGISTYRDLLGVDQYANNEGLLSVGAGGATSSTLVSNTTGSPTIVFMGTGGIECREASKDTIQITQSLNLLEWSDTTAIGTIGIATARDLMAKATPPVIISWDGNGGVVGTGNIVYRTMAYAGTITGWSITATGTSPTCTIDIYRVAAGGTTLPVAINTIMGTKPALSSGNIIRSSTLTSWNPLSFSAGDTFGFNIDACTNALKIWFTLEVQ